MFKILLYKAKLIKIATLVVSAVVVVAVAVVAITDLVALWRLPTTPAITAQNDPQLKTIEDAFKLLVVPQIPPGN